MFLGLLEVIRKKPLFPVFLVSYRIFILNQQSDPLIHQTKVKINMFSYMETSRNEKKKTTKLFCIFNTEKKKNQYLD